MKSRPLKLRISRELSVSALLLRPPDAFTCFVFAHGAGAGMEHESMQGIAEKLAKVNIATLRYQFPYMEAFSRRPDRPATCHTTVRSAVAFAGKRVPDLPLIAGGKSFGGRMTSQAQALEPLPGVVGLAFVGFPWHPAKLPSLERSDHLAGIKIPMLFMQGTRDTLGELTLVKTRIRKWRKTATLRTVPGADHGLHVPRKSGRTDSDVQERLVRDFAEWAAAIIERTSNPVDQMAIDKVSHRSSTWIKRR